MYNDEHSAWELGQSLRPLLFNSALRNCQCLLDIGNNIIHAFDAD